MGFFSQILDKLGFDAGDKKVADMVRAPIPPAATTAGAAPPAAPSAAATNVSGAGPATAGAAAPRAATQVDVAAQLEQKAAANPQKLNWRTSIVDLLKLLDIDSSLAARKELATELGCPPALMADSAQMNMWLHKTVLAQIAANGGQVPKELLD